MGLVEDRPDGWGPVTRVRDRVAEAVRGPVVVPHRRNNWAPNDQMLPGLLAESAEEARPGRGWAIRKPGRPWAPGNVSQRPSACVAKGVLCR